MTLRFTLRVTTLVAIVLVAAIVVSWASDHLAGVDGLREAPPTPGLLARGAYLAKLGDCAACHSVPGSPAFSGGLRMMTPIGAIYSTNITPDPRYGIGSFSLSDFDRALRFGVARGHTLYPAMPYTSYANAKPEDVAALYAYFKHSVTPAAAENHREEIPFPLSMRWPLTYWRWLFAPRAVPFSAAPGTDARLSAGAYFVEGLGHCGECHTPRGWAMQLKAFRPSDGTDYLSGAQVNNYFAPSLRSTGPGSLAGWSEADLEQFLTTGANARGASFGPMTEVVEHSTQYLTKADAASTALYLKSLADTDVTGHAGASDGQAAPDKPQAGSGSALGATAYLTNCAACHKPDGTGIEGTFPRLAGNPVVQASNAVSVVAVILQGSQTARTSATPAQFVMPPFNRLSDNEIAAIATFVRGSWGNQAAGVDAALVHQVREASAP